MARSRSLSVTTTLSALCAWHATAGAQDFNGNQSLDSIEIRNGSAPDCNLNGVPDAADVTRPKFPSAVQHYADPAVTVMVYCTAMLDFDQDGDLDVVTSTQSFGSDSYLNFWRNDGGAGLVFASRTLITNGIVFTMTVGDFNGDGRDDLAGADAGFAKVQLLLSTGPGTYGAPTSLTAAARGLAIASGDVDLDGDLDLAVTCDSLNTINVFKNNGNGTFAARVSYAVDVQPTSIAIGEFTGDTLPDLAVGNSYIVGGGPNPGTVSLLRNTGGGNFATLTTLTIPGHAETSLNSKPHDVVLSDIDLDGDRDLLVSAQNSESLTVWSNNGSGAFTNTQTLGPLQVIASKAGKIACRDLDGDSWPDVAWCDPNDHVVSVYKNVSGTFVFSQAYATSTVGPSTIGVGDLVGDALPEIVTANGQGYTHSVLTNLGGLNFDAVIMMRRPDASFYPFIADLTNDGISDIGTYFPSAGPTNFILLPGLGNNRFGAAQLTPMSTCGHVMARDIDKDGDLDLLSTGGHVIVRMNNGDGTFGPEINSDLYSLNSNIQTHDVNNDGHLDLIWTWTYNNNIEAFVRISLGDSTGHFAPYYEVNTPRFLGSIWFGDITGDGAPELFAGLGGQAVDPLLEAFLIYTNNGDGTFGPYELRMYDLAPTMATGVGGFWVGDWDGDADNDLLGICLGIWVFKNDGGVLGGPQLVASLGGYGYTPQYGPSVFDVDLDGDFDFIGLGRISTGYPDSPGFYFNDGNGLVNTRSVTQGYRSDYDWQAVGDINNDGRIDALVRPEGFGSWYIHLNLPKVSRDGNANGVPDECETFCPSDFNHDGFVSGDDFDQYVAAFESGDTLADFNADGFVTGDDFDAFVLAFEGGC